jgi:hypothetical protein
MNDNPFSSVVKTIREDNKSPESYRLGTVTSVSPLIVEVSGTSQDESDLLKNDTLTSFEIGDRLFLVPIENEQRYIIICKVVNI